MTNLRSDCRPEVSVVIPAYNLPELLLEAVGSVVEQCFEGHVETIVVDDASPRDLKSPLQRFFPEVRYVRLDTNAGTSAARDMGSRLATGHFIAYLDHDDVWLPGKLAMQSEALKRHPEAGWTFCDAIPFSAKGTSTRSIYDFFPQLRESVPPTSLKTQIEHPVQSGVLIPLILGKFFPIFPSTLMIRRKALEKVGGWNPKLRAAGEDWDLMIRASHHGEGIWQDAVLTKLRRGHGANQSDRILEHICNCHCGLEQSCLDYEWDLKRIVQPLLPRGLAGIGWNYYNTRNYQKAFNYYSMALKRGFVRPTMLIKWAIAGLKARKMDSDRSRLRT